MGTSTRYHYGSQDTAVWPQGTCCLLFLLGFFIIVKGTVASTEGMLLAVYQALTAGLSLHCSDLRTNELQLLPLCPFPCSVVGLSACPPLPQHFSTDPVAASIMKIHTFNRDRDRVKLGVDTIAK